MIDKRLAAVQYVEQLGWHIFPCHSVQDGKCTCGSDNCSSAGKHPRTAHGCKDASNDPEVVDDWWEEQPDSNVAVATGYSFWVLDLDGNAQQLLKDAQGTQEMPPVPIAKTPGPGLHLLFSLPNGLTVTNTQKFNGQPVDRRGTGGYIVLPPSNHINGVYKWHRNPYQFEPLPAPNWVLTFAGVTQFSWNDFEQPTLQSAPGSPEGERNARLTEYVTRWLCEHGSEGLLNAAMEWAGRCSPPYPESEVRKTVRAQCEWFARQQRPTVLPAETSNRTKAPWPTPLGDDAKIGLVGEMLETIECNTESDPAALVMQFLVMFGNLLNGHPHFVAEADEHPCALFLLLVGSTSRGRKGTSFGRLRELFQFDMGFGSSWLNDALRSGLSSGEGLIEDLATDKTGEQRRLIVEPEFDRVIRAVRREKNTLSSILRTSWDGMPLRVMTRNKPLSVVDYHISIIGHVTQEELRQRIETTDLCNGFLNRFLLCMARRARLLPHGGATDVAALARLTDRIHHAAEVSAKFGRMYREEFADALWEQLYADLSIGGQGLVSAVTGRAEAYVMRLATTYACLTQSQFIREEHLLAAKEVWRYSADSARYVFQDKTRTNITDDILYALRRAGNEGMTRTDISAVLGRHVNAVQIQRSLDSLEEDGLAQWKKETNPASTGRPIERWWTT